MKVGMELEMLRESVMIDLLLICLIQRPGTLGVPYS